MTHPVQSGRHLPLRFMCSFALATVAVAADGVEPQSYADWLSANEIPAATASPADRNGPLQLTNLEAFSYGLNPFHARTADLPYVQVPSAADSLQLVVRRNVAARGVRTLVQSSTDISSWTPAEIESEQVLWAEVGVEGRLLTIPYAGNGALFLRLSSERISSVELVRIAGGQLAELSAIGPLQVADYSIGKYEVTLGEWHEVRAWAVDNGYDLQNIGSGCADSHPVHTVNWYDVIKWCNALSEMLGLEPAYRVEGEVYRVEEFGTDGAHQVQWDPQANGYRLPSEAEWEFAARGGLQSMGYSFSGGNDLDAVGWWRGNSGGAPCALDNGVSGPTPDGAGTWPVGSKTANELGLHDMSGNVWEWCWDAHSATVFSRRIRGGSWLFMESSARLIARNSYRPIDRYYYAGFRIARN